MNLAVFEAATTPATLQTFTSFATDILEWLISTFGKILTFMIANPICFVGLIMSLVIAAVGILRHVIGG